MIVVVEKLSRSVYFILVKYTYKIVQIANIFMLEIFKLHEIRKVVISNRDVKFTSAFWKALLEGIGTQIQFSISYHYQTYG